MSIARGLLGFVAAVWAFFTVMMLGFGMLSLMLPGEQPAGETLKRMSLCIGTAVLCAIAAYAWRRLRPGDQLAWIAGIGAHLASIVVLLAGATWAITAPAREGLLAVSGLVVSGISAPSLVGLVLLLRPGVRRLSFRRQ